MDIIPRKRSWCMVRQYEKDLKVTIKDPLRSQVGGGLRKEITTFSPEARRRLRFLLRNTIDRMEVCLHLTYPAEFPASGQVCKKHLRTFLDCLRERKISYVWVMEFQRRGAPHFHLLIDSRLDKEWISKAWYRIVKSGDEKHLRAGTRIEAIDNEENRNKIINYLLSYIAKSYQKAVPSDFSQVGRFWGCSQGLLKEKQRWSTAGDYRSVRRSTRRLRKWYKNKLGQSGIDWRWKGHSFIAWEGSAVVSSNLKE